MRWVRGSSVVACVALMACQAGDRAPVSALPPVPWSTAPDLEVDLRAWQSAEKLALLAPAKLVVDLYCGPGIECDFAPAVPAGLVGDVQAGAFAPLGPGRTRRFVLSVRPTKLGELVVPPFRAEGKQAKSPSAGDAPTAEKPTGDRPAGDATPAPIVATTPELKITVESVVGMHGDAVEAPAPPFDPRFDPWPWVCGAAGLGVLGALFWWWRRRPTRRKQAAAETPLPAHVTALRALARLRSASRATPEEVDAFYVEVSRILRTYLEQRFGLHAPERTTEEFLAELNAQGERSPLDGRQRNALGGFLRQCDLVKFARVLPNEDVHLQSLRIAEELVEATRGDRVPGEAELQGQRVPQPQEVGS